MIVVIEQKDFGKPFPCRCGITYQVNNAPGSRKPRASETKPRNLRDWTPAEKADVVRCGRLGRLKEVAKKYEVSYSAVQSIFYRAVVKKKQNAS